MRKRIWTHDELFPPYSSDCGGNLRIEVDEENGCRRVLITAQADAAEVMERVFEWVAESLEKQGKVKESQESGLRPSARNADERKGFGFR